VAYEVLAMTFFPILRASTLENDKSFCVRKDGINRKIDILDAGTEMFD
jgi:hypothetical protein